MIDSFLVLWAAGCATSVERSAQATKRTATPEQFEPLTRALADKGRRYSVVDYLIAVQRLQRFSRDIARFLTPYDVWLTPTLAEPPLPLGAFAAPADDPLRALDRAVEFTPFTSIANVTGQPAMSVPLSWNAAGLPVGVQFIGRYGDEATLFRLAAQLEEARPWSRRSPPLSALNATDLDD